MVTRVRVRRPLQTAAAWAALFLLPACADDVPGPDDTAAEESSSGGEASGGSEGSEGSEESTAAEPAEGVTFALGAPPNAVETDCDPQFFDGDTYTIYAQRVCKEAVSVDDWDVGCDPALAALDRIELPPIDCAGMIAPATLAIDLPGRWIVGVHNVRPGGFEFQLCYQDPMVYFAEATPERIEAGAVIELEQVGSGTLDDGCVCPFGVCKQ